MFSSVSVKIVVNCTEAPVCALKIRNKAYKTIIDFDVDWKRRYNMISIQRVWNECVQQSYV